MITTDGYRRCSVNALSNYGRRKMIPLKLIFCVIAALFAAVTVISAQRRAAAATINCAVITGLSIIAMEWAQNRTVSVMAAYETSAPVVINRNQLFAWVLCIVLWVCLYSTAWFVATRADYAKLAAANACYSSKGHSRSTSLQCANVKPSDAAFYKSEIDRRRRIRDSRRQPAV